MMRYGRAVHSYILLINSASNVVCNIRSQAGFVFLQVVDEHIYAHRHYA